MKNSKKRILSFLLAIVCLFSLFPVGAFAADGETGLTARISSETTIIGSTVAVKVSIENNPGISSFKGELSFDESLLTLESIEYNAEFGGQFMQPQTKKSPVRLTWLSPLEDSSYSGTFATLTFSVAEIEEDNAVASLTMAFDPDNIYDMSETNIPLTVVNGSVTIFNGLPGDINMDQKVNNKDATRLFQYVAGWDVEVDEKAVDCNGDGKVNNKDATRLFQAVAGWDVEVYYGGKVTEKCNHTMEAHEAAAATCTKDGNTAYWYCTTCKKYFNDAAGTGEITRESTILPATGHTEEIIPATATTTEGKKCSVCHEILVEPQPKQDDGKMYTITFVSPLSPVSPIKRTINERVSVDWAPEDLHQYVWMGWTDADGNVVTMVEPGTGDITLYANWVSQRNQTISNDYLSKGPIIIEDEEHGQYLFVYDIGKIVNVPLYTIKDFGNTTSGIITKESESVTKSISLTTAQEITSTIVEATTNSATWTLSKDWNDLVTNTEDFSDTELKENRILVSDGYAHTDANGKNTGTVKDTGTLTKGNTTTKDLTTTDIAGELGFEVGLGKLSPMKAEISGKLSAGETTERGTITDDGEDIYNLTHTNNLSTEDHSTTTSSLEENEEKIVNEATKQWHYSIAKSTGETEGESKTSEKEYSDTESISTKLAYTIEKTTTNVREYSTEKAVPGYHRLVCAGTVHVFAVVGYDIAKHNYFYYSYSVLDDETHEFWDYSKNNAEYNDYETGVLPFEVPVSVHDYVSERVYLSDGLIVDDQTGTIVDYDGKSTYVNIPDYYSRDNGDGTVDLVKIVGFTADTFANRADIKTVRLSKYITAIPDEAFKNCSGLQNITYDTLTSIGKNAFDGCEMLAKFVVTNDVETLGDEAFARVAEVEINAANTAVAISACKSGAKKLIVNLLMQELHDEKLIVNDQTEEFTINGFKRIYKNVEISSKCTTKINGLTFSENTGVPITVESGNLYLTNVNISQASGYTMRLGIDPYKTTPGGFLPMRIILDGTNTFETVGDTAILCRDVAFEKKSGATVLCKLVVPNGKVLICGSELTENDKKLLNVQANQIDYVSTDVYHDLISSYTLLLDSNGGICSTVSKKLTPGVPIGDLPVPTKQNFIFVGWFTEISGGEKVTAAKSFSADTTLYAHWTPEKYTITFNPNGGTCSKTSQQVTYGSAIGTLPTPTRSGFTFEGWFREDGTEATKDSTFAKDETLRAHWLSDWVTSAPSGAEIVSTKWLFESSQSTVNGLLPYNSTSAWSDYGAWSEWSDTQYYESESRKVEPNPDVVASYNMISYVVSDPTRTYYSYRPSGVTLRYTWEYTWPAWYMNSAVCESQGTNHTATNGTAGRIGGNGSAYYVALGEAFDYVPMYIQSINYKTQYRYADRVRINTYYYEKVENGNSVTTPSGNGIINVTKYVQYRVK